MGQRLIDADALKEAVNAHDYVLKDCFNSIDKGMFTLGIMYAIDAQPTIDAVPAKRGEWIETDEWDEFCGRLYKCSNCKTFVLGYFDNYCPNCGARMDKE